MATDTSQPCRVTVRGPFDRLTDQQRRQLLDDADAHDAVKAGAFTEEGTLTYQRACHLRVVSAAVPRPGVRCCPQ